MNIIDLINEEFISTLNEIETSERIKTYPFVEDSGFDGDRYIVQVDEPEKNIHVNYLVIITPIDPKQNAYSLSFKVQGGDYYDIKNFGIQFRLLATISKIVKEFMSKNYVDILTFQPVKKSGNQLKGGRSDSQRMMLYLNYVKGGAGNEYDAFIAGDNAVAMVERRHPKSYKLQDPDIDAETIQDIVTQLSLYEGKYITDLPRNDPDYMEYGVSSWGGFYSIDYQGRQTRILSARKLVDEIFADPTIKYVRGVKDPSPKVAVTTSRPAGQQDDRDAPIEPIRRREPSNAPIGSFLHFMQTEIYGNPSYNALNPYFEAMKSLNDFQLLRERTRRAIQTTSNSEDRTRLLNINKEIESMLNLYNQYERRHQNPTPRVQESLEILNEIENLLK